MGGSTVNEYFGSVSIRTLFQLDKRTPLLPLKNITVTKYSIKQKNKILLNSWKPFWVTLCDVVCFYDSVTYESI